MVKFGFWITCNPESKICDKNEMKDLDLFGENAHAQGGEISRKYHEIQKNTNILYHFTTFLS